MITIFAVPRPFKGLFSIFQRNAIQSWIALRPKCEIILFGVEEGLAKAAEEFGVRYVPELKRNEFGTPYLNDTYNKAQEMANFPMVAYLNSDIILMNDFITAFKKINFPKFMMVGRRWNLDVKEEINFKDQNWERNLCQRLIKQGRLYSPSAMDYCVFPRNFDLNLPAFTVGRSGGSDNWQLYRAHSLGIPIIDVTAATTVIHQNHDNSSHDFKGDKGAEKKIEAQRNIDLRNKFYNAYTLRDADWILTKEGLKKRKVFPLLQFFYRLFGGLLTYYHHFNFFQKLIFFPMWFVIKIAQKIRNLILKKGKFWMK